MLGMSFRGTWLSGLNCLRMHSGACRSTHWAPSPGARKLFGAASCFWHILGTIVGIMEIKMETIVL